MEYQSRAARALVRLQMEELRALLETWRQARRNKLALPPTEDPDYADLESLLSHVLRSSRGYLNWICEFRGRPAPRIELPQEDVARHADDFLARLAAEWERACAPISVREMDSAEVKPTRWQVPFALESMFEHAVVHPMRHRLQLAELLGGERGGPSPD